MLNMADIEREINTLECGQITYPTLEKLSVLYTILDHFADAAKMVEPAPAYALLSAPESEFLQKANGAPINEVLHIIDEHMECVKALYPKEYSMIIKKIEDLAL